MNALLAFLLNQLIPTQIQKYKDLASAGIGPDARINARLVKDEVDDLIRIATELLENKPESADLLQLHFNEVWFYVEQEHIRGRAGWLIAKNSPHNRVYERTLSHRQTLEKIASENAISLLPSLSRGDSQEKCARYSHGIAFFILDYAQKLTQNPQIELPEDFPKHAQVVLRANAKEGGRYHQSPIKEEIQALYKRCILFLNPESKERNETLIQKTREMVQSYRSAPAYRALLKEEADRLAKEDYQKLSVLQYPNDKLAHPQELSSSVKKWGLFAATTLIGGALATCLIKRYVHPTS